MEIPVQKRILIINVNTDMEFKDLTLRDLIAISESFQLNEPCLPVEVNSDCIKKISIYLFDENHDNKLGTIKINKDFTIEIDNLEGFNKQKIVQKINKYLMSKGFI